MSTIKAIQMVRYRRQIEMEARRVVHGGEPSRNRRKVARPIATKRAMHLVLKSSIAIGKLSLHRHARWVRELVKKVGAQAGVRVYEYSNNGNHLHLLIRAATREGYKSFVRRLSGAIAQRVSGSQKMRPQGYKFWDYLPFTRIVEWGKDYENAKRYVIQNLLEAMGLIPYEPRKRRPASS